jgi:hypothetical protein
VGGRSTPVNRRNEVGERKYDEPRDNEEAESMNVETSTGAPPGLQARGQDAAMQSETATSADWPTSAEREGLTAPDVLFLALVALLTLIGLGSMMLVLAII